MWPVASDDYEADRSELIGSLCGKLAVNGDILSTGVDWHAQP
jgi:hypothetical protein